MTQLPGRVKNLEKKKNLLHKSAPGQVFSTRNIMVMKIYQTSEPASFHLKSAATELGHHDLLLLKCILVKFSMSDLSASTDARPLKLYKCISPCHQVIYHRSSSMQPNFVRLYHKVLTNTGGL